MIERGGVPDALRARAFSLADGLAAGMTSKQLKRSSLRTPYRGVRAAAHLPAAIADDADRLGTDASSAGSDSFALDGSSKASSPGASKFSRMLERCQDYAPRIARDAAFSGPTAATLLGLPLPWRLQNLESLHIAVPLGRPIPRTEGILGRRLRKDLMQYWSVSGMPVLSPLAAFLTCCRDLTEAEGTTMLDAVVTTMAHYPGLKFQERPGAAIGDVRATFMTLNRFHGGRVARAALAECRERVASPKESETRLLLVQAGLPEPEVNGDVGVGSLHIAEVDLLYREAKVAIEYEGDHHRTDQSQWRKDLERERNLRALGYEYIRVTQQTLSESPRAFVAHVAALLARRTPTA